MPRRLLALLRRERPALVLVEMSPASLLYRLGAGRRRAEAIRARLAGTPEGAGRAREARDLLSVLALPGELRAALRYAGESGAALALADLSRHARPKLAEIDAWAEEAIGRLERGEDPPLFERPARRIAWRSEEERAEAEDRERWLARAIRRALARGAGPVAHLGGFEHVAALARLLSDVRPAIGAAA